MAGECNEVMSKMSPDQPTEGGSRHFPQESHPAVPSHDAHVAMFPSLAQWRVRLDKGPASESGI